MMKSKKMLFLLIVLPVVALFTGCGGKKERIELGEICRIKVWMGSYMYELWNSENTYRKLEEYVDENYDKDIFEGEDREELIKKDAYENMVRTYILYSEASKTEESISTELYDENMRKAKDYFKVMGKSNAFIYKVDEEQIITYLNYQSLAGIWSGDRIEELKEEITKEDEKGSLSEKEVQDKAFLRFEEEYYKPLEKKAEISLDEELMENVRLK